MGALALESETESSAPMAKQLHHKQFKDLSEDPFFTHFVCYEVHSLKISHTYGTMILEKYLCKQFPKLEVI